MIKACVMDADAMRRALRRMAHELLERGPGAEDLVLAGIPRRGIDLAQRLSAIVKTIEGRDVPCLELEIEPYRDDRPGRGRLPPRGEAVVAGKRVCIVDDVLFTGRTVRAALDAVINHGRPAKVELLVLVDRGHRELPIRADYVGKNVPTARQETVSVHVSERDGVDEVLIEGETREEPAL